MNSLYRVGAFILIVFLAFSLACRKKQEPLVISVVYDPAGTFARSDLQQKLFRFNFTGHKTPKGQPTIVAWEGTSDYSKTLATVVPRTKPDLLIFDSPDDATRVGTNVEIQGAVDLCKPSGTCLAVIPAWVDKEKRRATMEVVRYLERD